MLGFFEEIFGSLMFALRQPVESFIRLETSDDDRTLVASDGSLVSFIRVYGARAMIGEAEYNYIIDAATLKLGSKFDRPGYAIQFYFLRDPQQVRREMDRLMVANYSAAKVVDLDLKDLLDERRRHLSKFLAYEEMWVVCWTRPSAITKVELEKAQKARAQKKWVKASKAQYPHAAIDALRVRHRSFAQGAVSSLEEMGFKVEMADVHTALQAVRASIYPQRANEKWRACLPGDPIPARQDIDKKNDYSDVLWPPLRRQIAVDDARVVNSTAVKIGNTLWSAVDMTLGPLEPSPFTQLLDRLIDTDTPFRMSFLIESHGISGTAFKKLLSSILGFMNDQNRQVRDSLSALQHLSNSEPVVRMRCSMATFAPANDLDLLERRVAGLIQAIESWGYCQATQVVGDPLDGVMSSALGIACASTATPAVAPFYDIMKLLPWQRASSPFTDGAVILRTPDGRPWPYQMGSPLTTTWFDLIFAQPGAGKSVLMNALNLGTCLSAGMAKLPFVAILDIGPSSSGLISLLRDSLPLDRRYEAQHFKLRMMPDYAINPFDTQLGCRYPLPDERSYLSELITLLCTPPGQEQPYDGIPQLVGLCVDEMYRWRDDATANAEPRPYLVGIDNEVDNALSRYNIKLPPEPLWWDVVDALFDKDDYHTAMLAQRQCSPTLADAVTAARRPQIRSLLEETQIGASAEGVIHAFERMIASAIREFPILSGVTKFDVGGARVCAIDLQDVSPQGDDVADRQTAIMYMLARNAMVRSWWLSQDALKNFPPKYRLYHENRIREIRELPKRISYDEFHRTSRSKAVRAQVIRDVREGRKWGVQIVLASQLMEDFSDDMVDLATGIWICGAAVSDRVITTAGDRFGLSETARNVMRYRLTGPKPSGAPVLFILGTNEGRYEQHLVNTLGPIELWALSTSAEDVAIRTQLYNQIGAKEARQLLAKAFPGGSARSEIRRRVVLRTESGEVENNASSAVIKEIVQELMDYAAEMKRNREDAAEREN
ncbi:MAG: type IV secretion protein IcmB [Bdellovibrionales bacterium]